MYCINCIIKDKTFLTPSYLSMLIDFVTHVEYRRTIFLYNNNLACIKCTEHDRLKQSWFREYAQKLVTYLSKNIYNKCWDFNTHCILQLRFRFWEFMHFRSSLLITERNSTCLDTYIVSHVVWQRHFAYGNFKLADDVVFKRVLTFVTPIHSWIILSGYIFLHKKLTF